MRLHVTFTLATAQSHGTRYIARSNDEDQHQYQIQHKAGSSSASTTLKSVLSLVCYTRPDLIPSSSTDYAVAVVVQGAGNEGRTMEGRGMMSWLLAENGKGQSRMSGRVTEGGDVLEVALELMPRTPIPKNNLTSYLNSSCGQTPASSTSGHQNNHALSTNALADMAATAGNSNNGNSMMNLMQMMVQALQTDNASSTGGSNNVLENLMPMLLAGSKDAPAIPYVDRKAANGMTRAMSKSTSSNASSANAPLANDPLRRTSSQRMESFSTAVLPPPETDLTQRSKLSRTASSSSALNNTNRRPALGAGPSSSSGMHGQHGAHKRTASSSSTASTNSSVSTRPTSLPAMSSSSSNHATPKNALLGAEQTGTAADGTTLAAKTRQSRSGTPPATGSLDKTHNTSPFFAAPARGSTSKSGSNIPVDPSFLSDPASGIQDEHPLPDPQKPLSRSSSAFLPPSSSSSRPLTTSYHSYPLTHAQPLSQKPNDPLRRSASSASILSGKNGAAGQAKMKVWAKGCLFCGRKESRVWRIRKKRKREGEEDEGDKKDGKEEVEKICDGCALDLPSVRNKVLAQQGLLRDPSSSSSSFTYLAPSSSAASGIPSDAPAASRRSAPAHTQTSPLRRSPRGHRSTRNSYGTSQGASSSLAKDGARREESNIRVSQTSPLQASRSLMMLHENDGDEDGDIPVDVDIDNDKAGQNKRRRISSASARAPSAASARMAFTPRQQAAGTSPGLSQHSPFDATMLPEQAALDARRVFRRGCSSPPRLSSTTSSATKWKTPYQTSSHARNSSVSGSGGGIMASARDLMTDLLNAREPNDIMPSSSSMAGMSTDAHDGPSSSSSLMHGADRRRSSGKPFNWQNEEQITPEKKQRTYDAHHPFSSASSTTLFGQMNEGRGSGGGDPALDWLLNASPGTAIRSVLGGSNGSAGQGSISASGGGNWDLAAGLDLASLGQGSSSSALAAAPSSTTIPSMLLMANHTGSPSGSTLFTTTSNVSPSKVLGNSTLTATPSSATSKAIRRMMTLGSGGSASGEHHTPSGGGGSSLWRDTPGSSFSRFLQELEKSPTPVKRRPAKNGSGSGLGQSMSMPNVDLSSSSASAASLAAQTFGAPASRTPLPERRRSLKGDDIIEEEGDSQPRKGGSSSGSRGRRVDSLGGRSGTSRRSTSRGGGVRINLLPATADKRGTSTLPDGAQQQDMSSEADVGKTLNGAASQQEQGHPSSDLFIDDFSSFLLKTRDSLFSPSPSPSPPKNKNLLNGTSTRSPLTRAYSANAALHSRNGSQSSSLAAPIAFARSPQHRRKSSSGNGYSSTRKQVPIPLSSDADFDGIDMRDLPPSSPPPLPNSSGFALAGSAEKNGNSPKDSGMSMMERYINSPGQHDDDEEEDAYRGQNGFGNGQSPISVGTSVTGGANTPQEYLAANPGSHAKGNRHHNPLVNGSGRNWDAHQKHHSSSTTDDFDMDPSSNAFHTELPTEGPIEDDEDDEEDGQLHEDSALNREEDVQHQRKGTVELGNVGSGNGKTKRKSGRAIANA